MRSFFLLILCLSSVGHAALFSKVWPGDLVAKALKGDQEARAALFSPGPKRQSAGIQAFNAYFDDMPEDVDPSTREAASYLLMEWISAHTKEFAGYWNARAHFGDLVVYQNHDLIDPRRIPPARVVLGEKQGAMYVLHDGDPMAAYAPGLGSSAALMRHGYPAVGPDAKPLMVCRLLESERAPYFEVSFSTLQEVAAPLRIFGSVASRCLSTPSGYWSERHADYFDNHGARITPRKTISVDAPL